MKIIQVRGSNGVGKTTVVRGFLENQKCTISDDIIHVNGRAIECHTTSDGVFVIGRYNKNACGGCDGAIKNAEELKNVLAYVARKMHPNIIIFEGVMYGKTVKLGMEIYNLSRALGAQFMAVCLEPAFDKALERIYTRNGGKEVNVKTLMSTWKSALKSNEALRAAGVPTRTFDTGNLTEEETKRILTDVLHDMEVNYER
jgi:hypothetical protein